MTDFLQRLRERKLVQWALAYVAAAFALIQVVDIVAQRFGWPDSIERILIIATCVGFFVVLVLAWYHGERGAQKVSGTELAILALLLAIGGGFLWRFQATVPVAALPGKAADTAPATPPAPSKTAPDKSIAVLPFENLSSDKDNEYFASGMQDMVLTKLADIGELKVISRTSTEKYKSHPDNLKQIAQELGVRNILEGSVQKAGNQVLINLQLIDAATDEHIWAQAYTKTLDNIFGVEGEVAQMVAEALKAKLSPTEAAAVARVPTRNKQAYDLYLKAGYYLQNSNRTGDADELARSVTLLKQAVDLDPDFSDAYAELALAYVKLRGHVAEASAAAQRALAIDPDNAFALQTMSYAYSLQGKHEKAIAAAERVSQLQPKVARAQNGLGFDLMFAGRFEDAIAPFKRAVALEPNVSTYRLFLSFPLTAIRDYAQARDELQAGLAHDPGDMSSVQTLAQVYLFGWGDIDAARKVLQAASQSPNQSIPLAQAWYQLDMYARDYPAALAVINKAPAPMFVQANSPKAQYLAQVYQAQGDAAHAQATFVQARSQLEEWIKTTPDQADLHANLALTLAGLGDSSQALAEAAHAVALSPAATDAWAGPEFQFALAQVQAQIGHVDAAVKQLRELLRMPTGFLLSVQSIKLDPAWDPIRKDPRFQALLKESATGQPAPAADGPGRG